ncbi:MAG: ComEC/Rec2 family competence protein [Bdellovibrionota bacterium]
MDQILYQAKKELPLLTLIALACIAVTAHQFLQKPRRWNPRAYSCHFERKTQDPGVKTSPEHRSHETPGTSGEPLFLIPRFFREWRKDFLEFNAPHDQNGLVRGIFLGDARAVARDSRDLFREAGLAHLLAASGYNCWIVAFVFSLIAKLGILVSGGLLDSRRHLKFKLIAPATAQLSGAWLFWMWTDQSPPITRAAVLISLKFAIETLGHTVPFFRLLFVQYLCSLVIAPRLWMSASFQLTYGCLFGIVWVPQWVRAFRPSRNMFGQIVWDYYWSGLGACLGALPTTWIVFQQVNFTSLLTNWFAVPIVSFGIMPVALLEMLLIPFSSLSFFNATATALASVAAFLSDFLLGLLSFWMDHVPALIIHVS